ncbi:MAG TPA: magnesium transporter CorA family protein [Prolixibacteraceae bacterium]|nr:magnesium transporter CorA family protein [Prolixibacteraceae bacterium]
MITYWEAGNSFTRLNEYQPNCWINSQELTNEEVEILINEYNVPREFVMDVLDIDERSRIEVDEDTVLIILRVPLNNQNNGIPFITVPLGIIFSNNQIITICSRRTEIIPSLIKAVNDNKITITNRFDYVLRIFLISAVWFLQFLKEINVQTALIEKDLENATKNKELHRLLRMEKCLVFFITSLKTNEMVLAKMRNSRNMQWIEHDEDLMEDVIIETKQALEMANVYSDIQSGMMDAFASVISNNLNVIMKQLTSVTIILMIPTLVASLYGMNVPNSFENSPYAFVYVIGISVLLSLVGILLIKWKNWF